MSDQKRKAWYKKLGKRKKLRVQKESSELRPKKAFAEPNAGRGGQILCKESPEGLRGGRDLELLLRRKKKTLSYFKRIRALAGRVIALVKVKKGFRGDFFWG